MSNLSTNITYYLHKIYNNILSVFIDYKYNIAKNPSISKKTIEAYNLSRLKGPKKIICYAPFKHVYFGTNGVARACCINKTDTYGTIKDNKLSKLWKSDKVISLREKILNYDLSGGCNYCHKQLESSNFKAFEGRMYDSLLPEIQSDYPTEMTFEISTTCNLECIMCNGNFSSSIRKNREKLPPLEEMYDSEFLNSIKDSIPFLKKANFIGGEPFLIPQYFDIIEYIIEHNQNCKLYIQTNGTILNNRVKRIIEHKNVFISISIDSLIKEKYEFIRKNASFNRLMENMDFFKQRALLHNQSININFCVMTNNWEEVPDMLSYCNKNQFSITFIPVEFPVEYNIGLLSVSELKNIVSNYKNSLKKKTLVTNKINVAKYNDLIKHIEFHLLKAELKLDNALQFSNQNSEVLIQLLNKNLKHQLLFDNEDILSVLKSIEVKTKLYDERNKRLFISSLLADLIEHKESIIFDYKHTDDWLSRFETTYDKYPII